MGAKKVNVSPHWLLGLSLYIASLFSNYMTPLAEAGRVDSSTNSVLGRGPYLQSPMDSLLKQRLMNGREVIPPISPNAIPGEPSCQELRAMWRYYKRQSRAEYTNEIPRFGSNLFWDILPPQQHQQQPQISSFAPIKGRSRARLKLKNNRNSLLPAYGRMTFKSERERQRNREEQQPLRPMQKVAQMMGKGGNGGEGRNPSGTPPEAIIHFSPPPSQVPTTPSSLQQIRAILKEEKMGEMSPVQQPPLPPPQSADNGKTFGRIILAPPRGSDGRTANKAKEFMSPFEKIRFGHADDLLDNGFKPNSNLMSKRRSVPLHKFPRTTRTGSGGNDGVSDFVNGWMDGDAVELDKVQLGTNAEIDYGTDEKGTWGSFPVGDNGDEVGFQPEESFQIRTFSNPIPELSLMDSPTCSEVEGQTCQTNSDCSCVGFGLYRCYINRCQTLSFTPPATPMEEMEPDASSLWHSGPVESNKLGIWEGTPAEGHVATDDNMNSNSNPFTRTASRNLDKENGKKGRIDRSVASSGEIQPQKIN